VLIASPRHRPEDLELWAELEGADRVSGARPSLAERVERSLHAIASFAADGPCYAGVSWGKDSTVLFDLVARLPVRIPVVWITYGDATNPDCRRVRDAALAIHPNVDYREIDVGESEAMRDDFAPAVQSTGTDRYVSGIRGEESGIRRMSLRRLGLATVHSCRPLGWWRLADVFGYLAVRGLPVHPNYAMLGGGRWPREHIRTASIGGERGVERGRRGWEEEYYGDVLRRLAARPPGT